MPESGQIPRAGWWPVLAWGGDLHLSPKGKHPERLEQEIVQATLARFDALVIPALRGGVPLYESETCRRRGQLPRYPWSGIFRRRPSPFEQAVGQASDAGLRIWAQMDIVGGGSLDVPGPSLGRSRPRWTLRNPQGRPTPIGADSEHLLLCPANPEVERLLCEVAVEIASGFPITALVLDVRSLPSEVPEGSTANCLCFHCQEKAAEQLGFDLQEALDDGTPDIWQEWHEWRVRGWIELVRRIRSQVWSVRPGLPIFARAGIDQRPVSEENPPPTRTRGPLWQDWARSGFVEMVLLDAGPGTQAEAEREVLESLPLEDLDCLFFPMFREVPGSAKAEQRSRALRGSLPGWGLTQRLSELWTSTILLKPVPRHGEASTFPALEIDPLGACIASLGVAERMLVDMPLGGDVQSVRATLIATGRTLELETLENLLFQLGTLVTMLDQDIDKPEAERDAVRGWTELARRLLRWHTNLNSHELYLFDAG